MPRTATAAPAPIAIRDRYRGTLLGLAAGDALGAPLEGAREGWYRITTLIPAVRHGAPVGAWTDDTAQALCLAASLLTCGRLDQGDLIARIGRWLSEGYLSALGVGAGSGRTTREAVAAYLADPEGWLAFVNNPDPRTRAPEEPGRGAGNGSLMRLAPLVLWALPKGRTACVTLAAEQSRATHPQRAAVDSCRAFAALLFLAHEGRDKDEILHLGRSSRQMLGELHPDVVGALSAWRTVPSAELRSDAYAPHTLGAALWAFSMTENLPDCLRYAVNLGGDADTTGAVAGALAGAYYGVGAIPAPWRETLLHGQVIERYADLLLEASQCDGLPVRGPLPLPAYDEHTRQLALPLDRPQRRRRPGR